MVLAVKIKKENANKLLRKLYSLDLINKEFKIKNKDDFVFIPIKNEKINEIKELRDNFDFEIEEREDDFFERKKNNEEKEELLVKSFDLIGDIAITIIPEELKDKKEEIGRQIAKIAKVKTVLAEKGKREGEFRLQKFELIYGEDKRETIYKENNCKFLVDVEKVYFSPRLSTDRMELAKEIKENEDVLVMFSGIQPYPIVIAKNSKANLVVGIEKNPNAFYYSKENIKINKLSNVFAFIGDVKEVLPLNRVISLSEEAKIEEYKGKKYYVFEEKKVISPVNLNKKLGIKTSINKEEFLNKFSVVDEIDNLNKKISHFVVEIFVKKWEELRNENLEPFISFLKEKIEEKGLKPIIVVHQPYEKGLKEKIKNIDFLLFDYFIVHPFVFDYDTKELIYNFESINEIVEWFHKQDFKEKIIIENVYFKPLVDKEDILKLIENKVNICFDFSHYFVYLLSKENKEKAQNDFINDFKEFLFKAKEKNIIFYCHINDFPLEGQELGKGIIPIEKVLPFVEFGITEVNSKNELEGLEIKKSFKYLFNSLKFDRIIMPLPKGSENFLDLAFKNIKNNGIIHWYQFIKEEEIEKAIDFAKEEAKKQNKEVEIIKVRKVGQIAPRTYRVRIDLKVIDKSNNVS